MPYLWAFVLARAMLPAAPRDDRADPGEPRRWGDSPNRHLGAIMDCLVRVGAGYLMWHSFRAAWAIGPRHLSEGFTLGSTRLAPELRQFPNARPVPYTL